MIYADNAATTKLDMDAFEAMKPYLLSEYGNASQPYSFSRASKRALSRSRNIIAECIGALPEEIFFTSGGTESDNWAIKGSVSRDAFSAVITSEFEHHAILRTCVAIEKAGHPVSYLRPTKAGFVVPAMLDDVISDETKLVSIMMVNNEIGTIQPIKELCRRAHEYGALFHTDAVQAAGHMPLNVRDLEVDMLSCSAHKFNGPKGIGFLFIRKGTKIDSYVEGGAQEQGMRAGTENVASIVGMAEALKNNVMKIKDVQMHLQTLESIISDTLTVSEIDYRRNGEPPHIPGNLSLSFKGFEGEMLLHRLDLMGIMVSTGSACDSRNTQISHVLKAIEADKEYASGTIRISLGKDNTEEEAVKIAKSLIKIMEKG